MQWEPPMSDPVEFVAFGARRTGIFGLALFGLIGAVLIQSPAIGDVASIPWLLPVVLAPASIFLLKRVVWPPRITVGDQVAIQIAFPVDTARTSPSNIRGMTFDGRFLCIEFVDLSQVEHKLAGEWRARVERDFARTGATCDSRASP